MDVKKNMKTNEFILIEAEELSMDDDFMKYEPVTDEEKELKSLISEVIQKRVKNFYRPNCDPSFTEDGKGICFVSGNMPAVGKSYNWWDEAVKKYKPERNSRLGTRLQYAAFLGVFIKKLIEEGKTVEYAWNIVCNVSNKFMEYLNSKTDYDLIGSSFGNTFKILAEDECANGHWLAGGVYCGCGCNFPPAALYHYNNNGNDDISSGIGWIVLD